MRKFIFSITPRTRTASKALERLMQKRNEQKKKELLKAVEESDKSIDEIIELIRHAGSSDGDEDIES